MSGTQRLSNGNTFIVDSVQGHFFEVTKEGDMVWDFVNPYAAERTGAFVNNAVFKARRYSLGEIDWPEKIPPPKPQTLKFCSWKAMF
jgi:hypothetical protein